MSRTKLNKNSLYEAVMLISNVIDGAIHECWRSDEYKEERTEIRKAWELICTFGDLDDTEDVFDEFVWHYNVNHKLE